ncbi:MAG: lamin tail domain-containing protein [Nanoarchaeota archaeon]
MKELIFIFILLFSLNVYADTYINEINYNPEGEDNNFEYIELYSDEILSNLTLRDLKSSDELELVKEVNSNYYLIVEEEFNYSDLNCNIFFAGKTIGNNLNNDRDSIVIEFNGTILDVVGYSDSYGGNNNGKVLCKIPDLTGVLQECIPTKCKENSVNISYRLKINEILPDPKGDDNAEMPNGEWIEIYNEEGFEIDLSGFYLEDLFGHTLFISETNTLDTIVNPKGYLVVYVNGFSGLLNNEGFEEISLFSNEGILIEDISYGSSREEVSWSLVEDKWILSLPTPGEENPEKEEEIRLDSKLEIEKVYLGSDEKAKWGDNLRFKLKIYKGDTTKQSVQAWIKKGSETVTKRSRVNVEERFFEYPVTLSLQIDPNCDNEYKDGRYDIIVQGLDTEDTKSVEIFGINEKFCEQPKVRELLTVNVDKKDLESNTETDLNGEFFSEITGDTIYISRSEKQKNIVIYLFSFLLVMIIMYLLLKKNG